MSGGIGSEPGGRGSVAQPWPTGLYLLAWVWAGASTLVFNSALDGVDDARTLGIATVLGLLLRLLIALARRDKGVLAWFYIAFMAAMPVLWRAMEEGMRLWRG